jgi:drug/metabolite transporter (DMT)-like permease
MRLILLTTLTMIAFAANSVLNRMGIVVGGMDALTFGVIRLVTGAIGLAAILLVQKKSFHISGRTQGVSVASLLVYIFGFSLAYQGLDAGFGALVLFGVIQLAMFVAAALRKDPLPPLRILGAVVAFGGLVWLLWPEEEGPLVSGHVFAMVLAGIGWGIYSLAGLSAKDATQATAMNFILAAPIALIAVVLMGAFAPSAITATGLVSAIISGLITSGMGYSLWYAIIPQLGISRAAVAQLTVPVIAIAGGAVFLSEPLSVKLALATVIVLGGVALSLKR